MKTETDSSSKQDKKKIERPSKQRDMTIRLGMKPRNLRSHTMVTFHYCNWNLQTAIFQWASSRSMSLTPRSPAQTQRMRRDGEGPGEIGHLKGPQCLFRDGCLVPIGQDTSDHCNAYTGLLHVVCHPQSDPHT